MSRRTTIVGHTATEGNPMGNLLTGIIAAAVISAFAGLTLLWPVKVKSTFGDKTE
jgi:hypothetical protein